MINRLLATYRGRGLRAVAVTASPYGLYHEIYGYNGPVGVSDLLAFSTTYRPSYPLLLDQATRVFNLYGRGASFPTY